MRKRIDITKEDLFDLYYNKKYSTVLIADIYKCSSRTILNYLKLFGFKARNFSEASIISSKNRTKETLLARAQKVRATWYSRSKEDRDRINKSRAIKPENVAAAVEKAKITKMKNNSAKKSKSEDSFYESLLISFNENDIIRSYMDERYPFNCDFYIKSLDLFIEYQGHPSHGFEPFDPLNLEHINFLLKLTLCMDTWTRRDVHKKLVALNNKINLILIYPRHKNYFISNGTIRTIEINELYEMNLEN